MKVKELFKEVPIFMYRGDEYLYEWIKKRADMNFELGDSISAENYISELIEKKMGVGFLKTDKKEYVKEFAIGSGLSDGLVGAAGWKKIIIPNMISIDFK